MAEVEAIDLAAKRLRHSRGELAYDYLVRNGRVAHAQVRERDPELAAAYEKLHPEVA